MRNRRSAFVIGAAAAVGLLMASATDARSSFGRRGHLTFNQAVALPGVVLPAGSYTFESGPAGANPDLVLVRPRTGGGPLYLRFTARRNRPAGLPDDQSVVFGEAPEGSALPIAVWYEPGVRDGHEFLYR
jgi:hypothetical protein